MLPRNRIQLYYVPVKAIGSILSKKSPHPYFVAQHAYYILQNHPAVRGGLRGEGWWGLGD